MNRNGLGTGLGGPLGGKGNDAPAGVVSDPYNTWAPGMQDAQQDPNAFMQEVERYRQQFGSLPVALRAALRGGNITSEVKNSTGMVGGAGSQLPGRTGPVAG